MTERLHILVVAPHLPPNRVGGVEVYSQGLMRAYHARGHRVQGAAVETIAHGVGGACTAETDETDGFPVHRLALTLPDTQPFVLLAEHAAAEAWFETLLRRTRPDLVHVQSGYLVGAPALAAAARTGTPAVLTLHDYWFACPRITLRHPSGEICSGPERSSKCDWCLGADRRRYHVLDRLSGGALERDRDDSHIWRAFVGGQAEAVEVRQQYLAGMLETAAVVLAPVQFVADQVARIGYPRDRIQLSRCGIPPMPRRPRAADGSVRLAFIGQVAPHKGVHLAVEAVRALPGRPVALDIHGPLDPYPDYVAALRAAAQDDPRITFHGAYRRDALPDILAAADAVVVPSVWHEVAALTIQEAQMAGTPVIASALGGSPELVRDEIDGLLFDPADPDALVRQCARLLDEPGLRARLAAGVRAPRSVDDEVDALLALYGTLVTAS